MSTNPQSDQAGRVVSTKAHGGGNRICHAAGRHSSSNGRMSTILGRGTRAAAGQHGTHAGAIRSAVQTHDAGTAAGTRLSDESWLACAQRELREETGYRAARFTPLGEICRFCPIQMTRVLAIYLAEELTPDPCRWMLTNRSKFGPMSFHQLTNMAHNGDLQDAKSIIAILRAARH